MRIEPDLVRDEVGLQPGHLALPPDERRRLGQLAGERDLDDRARAGSGGRPAPCSVHDRQASSSPTHPAAMRRSIERTNADGSVPVSSARNVRYAW